MQQLSCDWLFTGKELLRNHSLVLDAEGKVLELVAGRREGATRMAGLVSPAFVNAHCHLELSHLRGRIPRHTGMAGFVRALQPIRDQFSEEEKAAAMEAAVLEMKAGGIAAVGDICNGVASLPIKQAHPELHFHNFIELFGLNPAMAEEFFFRGLDLLKTFGRNASITPHAPYSMSVALRDKLLGYAQRREWPVSIHLLESVEERMLFEDLEGPLLEFIRDIGAVFQAHTYATPTDFVLEALPKECNALLVHMTELYPEELTRIVEGWPRAYIVLCPLANEYIHGRLPDAPMMSQYADRICLGTDSLAGNDRLSILAEAQALQSAFALPTATLLQWASLNGAKALGLRTDNFAIAAGHRPKLIHLPEFTGQLSGLPSETPITCITTSSPSTTSW